MVEFAITIIMSLRWHKIYIYGRGILGRCRERVERHRLSTFLSLPRSNPCPFCGEKGKMRKVIRNLHKSWPINFTKKKAIICRDVSNDRKVSILFAPGFSFWTRRICGRTIPVTVSKVRYGISGRRQDWGEILIYSYQLYIMKYYGGGV